MWAENGGINRGAAYIYERNEGGADNWGEAIKLQALDGASDDAFGHAVAISGHRLWCGAPYVDDVTASSGAAYRFDLELSVPEVDLYITVDNGISWVVPGDSVNYTIVVGNAGPSNVAGATVSDVFPADLTGVGWTCVGANGGICTASGSGDILETVDLPVGATVTYTATGICDLAATGLSLDNTAAVAGPVSVTELNSSDNTATDDDEIVRPGDLIFSDDSETGDVSAW